MYMYMECRRFLNVCSLSCRHWVFARFAICWKGNGGLKSRSVNLQTREQATNVSPHANSFQCQSPGKALCLVDIVQDLGTKLTPRFTGYEASFGHSHKGCELGCELRA